MRFFQTPNESETFLKKPPENAKCACLQDADKRKGIESGIQMI